MNVKNILVAARALIADPERWTTGAYARRNGTYTYYSDPDAECYCSVGAIYRALWNESGRGKFSLVPLEMDMKRCALALARVSGRSYYDDDMPDGVVIGFNDGATHAEVLAMFDKAIEAEGETP